MRTGEGGNPSESRETEADAGSETGTSKSLRAESVVSDGRGNKRGRCPSASNEETEN